MAITVVQTGSGTDPGETNTSPNISAPFGSNNTAGNLLFFYEGSYKGTQYIQTSTFTDTQSNFWQTAPADSLVNGYNLYAKCCLNCKSGANTITGTMSGTTPWSFDFVYAEISAGGGLSWALDGAPTTTARSASPNTTITSNNVVTNGSNNIIFAVVGTTTHQSPTAAGWTTSVKSPYGTQLYYKVVTSPGTYNFTATITSDNWAVSIFSFTATTPGTYYVAAAGSDSNTGLSPLSPWQTLTKLNAHPFVAGDTILFNGGDTFPGGIQITNGGGIPNNLITFGSYGTGVPTISTPSGPHGLYAYNCGYITVQGINFSGPALTIVSGNGVYFFTDQVNATYSNITINNVNATGYTEGIYFKGSSGWHSTPGNGFNNVRITNCNTPANSDNGILISDKTSSGVYTNVYIGYCNASNNTGINTLNPWTGSGIFCGLTNGGTVEYCIASNNGTTGHGGVGIWGAGSNNVIFQFCESYNNKSTGFDGDGFDIDGECTNCIIQYCYSHGNVGAGFLLFQYSGANTWSGNTLRYCIAENNNSGEISIGGQSGNNVINASIYNNTVYNGQSECLLISNGFLTTAICKNNIFVSGNTKNLVSLPAGTLPGITFANNDYFPLTGTFQISWNGTTYTSLATWGQDTTGLTSNPQLLSPSNGGTIGTIGGLPGLAAYRIKSTSPMINAGATITSPGSRDFYGNTLYYLGQIDVGANEFTPAPPVVFVNPTPWLEYIGVGRVI